MKREGFSKYLGQDAMSTFRIAIILIGFVAINHVWDTILEKRPIQESFFVIVAYLGLILVALVISGFTARIRIVRELQPLLAQWNKDVEERLRQLDTLVKVMMDIKELMKEPHSWLLDDVQVQKIESEATRIRVMVPNLYHENQPAYVTVIAKNLLRGTQYDYFLPAYSTLKRTAELK